MIPDYESYRRLGGLLPEGAYLLRAQRARRLIDRMTRGRLVSESPLRESVRMAIFEMVEEEPPRAGIQSMQNDALRVTWFGEGPGEYLHRLRDIARQWLDGETIDGVHVLYAGTEA